MKTHWKKQFNYDYLGAYSLQDGKEVTLTMASTKKEKVTGGDGKKQDCFICYFKEQMDWVKPMILNRTNCKTIEKIYGTPYIEEWQGKQITIYIQSGIRAFGDVVDALRIKPEKPAPPELKKGTPAWESAVQYVRGGNPILNITKKYSVSSELLNELENEIKTKE